MAAMTTHLVFTRGRFRYKVCYYDSGRPVIRHFWRWHSCERFAASLGREPILAWSTV